MARRHRARRRNPENKTLFIALAALGGLAAAYFANKSSSAPPPPLIDDGGGGGGGGGSSAPNKTALYGTDAIKAYQQRVRQVYTTLRDFYFPNKPEFFAKLGLTDPGPADGKWGPMTERASQAFIALGKKSLEYAKQSAAAMAAQDAAAAAGAAPKDYPFHIIPSFTPTITEQELVAKIARFNAAGAYISTGDWWAFYGGTGIFKEAGVQPWPFENIGRAASNA
jgi:hypothetical protein